MATTARQNGKHPGGRPRTKSPAKWPEDWLRDIDAMAEAQCKDTTIAETLGVDVKLFQREFAKRTRQKRAKGKSELHRMQQKRAKKGSDTMLIWLGKQHLEQSDRQELNHGGQVQLVIVQHGHNQSPNPK